MRKLSWIICVGPMSSQRSLKVEDISWLWSDIDMTTEDWSERYNITGFAVEKGGHKQRKVGQSREHRRSKEMDIPLEPREGTQVCQHLDFSPLRSGSQFWPTVCKIINVCCFKPLSGNLLRQPWKSNSLFLFSLSSLRIQKTRRHSLT